MRRSKEQSLLFKRENTSLGATGIPVITFLLLMGMALLYGVFFNTPVMITIISAMGVLLISDLVNYR